MNQELKTELRQDTQEEKIPQTVVQKKEKAGQETQKKFKSKKGHKKLCLTIGIILLVLLTLFGVAARNPRVRLLLSIVHFTESTMKNPAYMLYDVDIMEVFSDYFNGETQVEGKVGFTKLRDLPASMSMEMEATRSMDLKEFTSSSTLSILWFEAGNVNFYAKDQNFYIEAPILGDDFGYNFPTGLNLFPKMPELTSDFSREWFHDNYGQIVKLMTEIQIEETGESYTSEDGSTGEEFQVTIPEGSGHFIWNLLGMEDPDYDVVVSIYLTKANHMSRIEISLEDVLPGASIVVDGESVGTMYFYYNLPDNERMEMSMVRNPDHNHWVDCSLSYYTNVDTLYQMNSYITWDSDEEGAELSVKDLEVRMYEGQEITSLEEKAEKATEEETEKAKLDVDEIAASGTEDETEEEVTEGELLAQGYFEGSITKLKETPKVLEDKQSVLDTFEVIEWRTVRDDTDVFVQGILNKLKGK